MNDETKIDDGGPAFPFSSNHVPGMADSPGMTLRDWFAGMALASVYVDAETSAELCSKYAYELADQMLKMRSSQEPTNQGN